MLWSYQTAPKSRKDNSRKENPRVEVDQKKIWNEDTERLLETDLITAGSNGYG